MTYGLFLIAAGLLGFVESTFFVEGIQPFSAFAHGCLMGTGIYWINTYGTRS